MPLGDEGRKALAHAGAPGRFRDGHESILSVGGKDTEILSAYAEGSKMPLVERGDVTAHVTIREDYDRGVGHSDVEVVKPGVRAFGDRGVSETFLEKRQRWLGCILPSHDCFNGLSDDLSLRTFRAGGGARYASYSASFFRRQKTTSPSAKSGSKCCCR